MLKFIFRLFGDPHQKQIKKLLPIVKKINELEPEFEKIKTEDLKLKTLEFKERLKQGQSLDDILPEAFALVREAAKRTIGQRHYDVQLLGGIVLHQGKITEMRTGEGKTLVATLPLYLNSLTGKSCHLVTVNDYLAQRDTAWMGQIYHLLGLKVSCIVHEASYLYDPTHQQESKDDRQEEKNIGVFKVFHKHLRPISRREAYLCDITYGTNNEFGFDYLRDNLVYNLTDVVQREHYYAIVDEVDSILIDEARTPLIISQPDFEATKRYYEFARYLSDFVENEDYNVDYKMKAVSLTEKGIDRITKLLGRDPYKEGDVQTLHHITQALRAKALYKRDRDYVVRDGEVIIVDEFTGRLLYGRRFSEGLHQAIEAQENVEVKAESKTLATITFQNYFRLYQKLAGMTGTAETSSEEFYKVYNLEVVVIPTHKPMIRKDYPDKIYKTEKEKYEAIVKEVLERYKKGQPVLIGTRSIDKNEQLSKYLKKANIPHHVLNAKNHEKEGEIIAQAGRFKSVTVATNMAGRGVDIILGGNPPTPEERERVIKAGGLFVLGTERHEARRIDNQLRGRAGRQGDPGESQFIVSLEDEILRVLGGDRLKQVMERFHMPDNEPIQHPFISSLIEKAQSKIEALNFDLRKHVLEYDDVLNIQRQTIYRLRRQILQDYTVYVEKKIFTLKDKFLDYVKRYLKNLIETLLPVTDIKAWDIEEVSEEIKNIIKPSFDLHKELDSLSRAPLSLPLKQKEIIDYLYALFVQEFEKREKQFGQDLLNEVLKYFILQNIDFYWQEHLTVLQDLREAVRLRAYGQRDPLVEYKTEARRQFSVLLNYIEAQVVNIFFKIQISSPKQEQPTRSIILSREEVNVLPDHDLSNNTQLGAGTFKTKSNIYYQYHQPKREFGRKIGRNEPCPCGAKKPNGQPIKYKHCHGKAV